MKVTVCFGAVRIVVPCGSGDFLVNDLINAAVQRYKKAVGMKLDSPLSVQQLSTQSGILCAEDFVRDVVEDREEIFASFESMEEGASLTKTAFRRNSYANVYDTSEIGHNRIGESPMAQISNLISKRESNGHEIAQQPQRQPFLRGERLSMRFVGKEQAYQQAHYRSLRQTKTELEETLTKDCRPTEINGKKFTSLTKSQIQQQVRRMLDFYKNTDLNISEERNTNGFLTKMGTVSSTTASQSRNIGHKVKIVLTKGPQGLGFSVTTQDNSAGRQSPIYIKHILAAGAAIKEGHLRPGDRLLEVDGLPMTGKTQPEAVAILRAIKPGAAVQLVVSRQEGSIDMAEKEQSIH